MKQEQYPISRTACAKSYPSPPSRILYTNIPWLMGADLLYRREPVLSLPTFSFLVSALAVTDAALISLRTYAGVFPVGWVVLAFSRCSLSEVSFTENEISLSSPKQKVRDQDKMDVKLKGASAGIASKALGRAVTAQMVFGWTFLRCWVSFGSGFVSACSLRSNIFKRSSK